MSWNPAPTIGSASWQGNPPVVTKTQLLSSVAGLYNDIQDFNFSSITVTDLKVSTLTSANWISTPELYVSSIIGGGLQVNDALLQISTGDFSLVSLSTLSLKGIDLGGINLSFDLGLGNALGGLLGGLGAVVGGAFIGIGTGVGLTIQGLETGLATLINGRGENFINNNFFETINGSTQLQISTLGGPDPYYSSIFRTVSSSSANSVPGAQIFVSTIFPQGTTCIRSVSDPLSILSSDSNIVTSTIQSFGQWVPFQDDTPTGEDIRARYGYFSTLFLNPPPAIVTLDCEESNVLPNKIGLLQNVNITPTTNNYNVTSNQTSIATSLGQFYSIVDNVYMNNTINFISSPYNQYTSSIGDYVGGVYFIQSTITSNLSTIPKFTWVGSGLGGGNFAVCEPDETGFLSSFTLDLVAQSSNVFLQWGFAVDNRNSTIAQGTSKRVSWNNTANTSNFIDIPVPQSTTVTNTQTNYQLVVRPLEVEFQALAIPDNGSGGGRAGMVFDINRAVFGGNTTYQNQPGYPYQFNNNVFVDGILEADTLIATSSILAVSTNIQTFFSTQTFEADEATISSAVINFATASNVDSVYIEVSTLYSTDLIGGNSISSFGMESYNNLSQFSYVSTLVVDFQIFGNLTPGVISYLQDIRGSNGAKITTDNGIFTQVSTTNLATSNIYISSGQQIGLTTIYNYPGATTVFTASGNTAPFVGFGFKAQLSTNQDNQTRVDYNWNQITGTSNGANFYPMATFDPVNNIAPNLWTLNNIGSLTTSTMNVNTISTTSHSGSEIICDDITINNFATFPSVANGSNIISMSFSNSTNSNSYNPLQATIIQGSVFPQTSNQFTITTSGSNTQINDRQGLLFTTTTGTEAVFGGNIDDVILNSANLSCRQVKYGTNVGGFLIPRCFAMSNTTGFGAGTTITTSGQITDGTNTFVGGNYNCQIGLRSFSCTNSAVAYNTVIVVPYIDAGTQTWYWSLSAEVNVGTGGADGIFSWTVFLFPNDMMP